MRPSLVAVIDVTALPTELSRSVYRVPPVWESHAVSTTGRDTM